MTGFVGCGYGRNDGVEGSGVVVSDGQEVLRCAQNDMEGAQNDEIMRPEWHGGQDGGCERGALKQPRGLFRSCFG